MAESRKEIWVNINERYSVSSLGRVRSNEVLGTDSRGRKRKREGKILSLKGNIQGYPVVNISDYKNKKTHKVHQLVAAFFIPNPKGYKCINHINGIKDDNRVENLEWCTYSWNIEHSYKVLDRKPVVNKGSKNGFSKSVVNIKNGDMYGSLKELCREVNTGYKYSALKAMLNKQNPNKTDFRYVSSP